MKNKLAWVFISIISIGMVFFYVLDDSAEQNREVIKHAEEFVTRVAEAKDAKEYAAGTVLYSLSTQQDDRQYKVIGVESTVETAGEQWALVNIKLETEKQGVTDVNHYKLHMIKNPTWKVYRLEEMHPLFSGVEKEFDVSKAENIFGSLINELSSGNYDKAGNFLTGRAKTAHYQASEILGPVRMLEGYDNLQLDLLYAEDGLAVTNITYNIGDKELALVVSFQLTGEGWKVYDISQI